MTNELEKTIYDLKLHEELYASGYKIHRVPGGWIYVYLDKVDTPVFVPFSDEFKWTTEPSK